MDTIQESKVPKIAAVSWLIQNDAYVGRRRLNVSEWGISENEAEEAAQKFVEGEMPPAKFLLLHPQARLSAAEKQELYAGMLNTFGTGEGEGGGGEDDDD